MVVCRFGDPNIASLQYVLGDMFRRGAKTFDRGQRNKHERRERIASETRPGENRHDCTIDRTADSDMHRICFQRFDTIRLAGIRGFPLKSAPSRRMRSDDRRTSQLARTIWERTDPKPYPVAMRMLR